MTGESFRLLRGLQRKLEETYGAVTGLDVTDFVRSVAGFRPLGQLVVEQAPSSDLNVALLLDRDILAAWESRPTVEHPSRALSVVFEELSHFVYLAFNHQRGRNITALELEMQSEVDRVLLAFHSPFQLHESNPARLLAELLGNEYEGPEQGRYEASRRAAATFIRHLGGGNPGAWTASEFDALRKFFHSDLSEKLRLSNQGKHGPGR